MDYGLGLPTSGPAASPGAILEAALEAERIGLATVWTYERLLRPRQQATAEGARIELPDFYASVYEPIETLAYVAARTSRVRLGTSVIDALFHSPLVLGRRLATLDRLSGGRVVAGLGQGWMAQEFAAAGVSPRRRGAGFDEHVRAMRAVWGPDPVSFAGRFYTIPESDIGPKPVQPGGPLLLAGAMAPAAIERAARLGMGWNPVLMDWEGLEAGLRTFREAVPAGVSLPVVVRVNGSIGSEPSHAVRAPATGPIEAVAEDLARLEALGVDEVLWSMEVAVADQIDRIERLLRVAPSVAR
jgi:probable F420-dependent oxidoreductase